EFVAKTARDCQPNSAGAIDVANDRSPFLVLVESNRRLQRDRMRAVVAQRQIDEAVLAVEFEGEAVWGRSTAGRASSGTDDKQRVVCAGDDRAAVPEDSAFGQRGLQLGDSRGGDFGAMQPQKTQIGHLLEMPDGGVVDRGFLKI